MCRATRHSTESGQAVLTLQVTGTATSRPGPPETTCGRPQPWPRRRFSPLRSLRTESLTRGDPAMAVRSELHNRNQEAQRQRRDTAGMVLGLAMIATGLSAGLLYSYACSVLPGLAQTSDRTFIDAMQQ